MIKELVGIMTITKRVLNLKINLTINKFLASTLVIEK